MSGISDFDRLNVGLILDGHGSWFSAELLRLIAHADASNLARLRLAFPEHVQAFTDWQESPVEPW